MVTVGVGNKTEELRQIITRGVLEAFAEVEDEGLRNQLKMEVLGSLVATIIKQELDPVPVQDLGMTNLIFGEALDAVAEAVAQGVAGARIARTGHSVSYYCDIQPEPTALSAESC